MWALKDRTIILLQSLAVTFTALLLIMGLVRFWQQDADDFTNSEYFRQSRELEAQTVNDPLNVGSALRLGNFYYKLAKSEENWLNNDITTEYEVVYYIDQIDKWKQLGYDVSAYANELQHGVINAALRESFQQQQMQVCSDAYDRALKYYCLARAIDPECLSSADKYSLGVIYLKKGDAYAAMAEAYIRAAYDEDYRVPEVATCLGNIAYQRKDLDNAVKWYQLALEGNKDDLVVNFNLALALLDMKEYQQAATRFQHILTRDAIKDGYYRGMLAHIHLYLGQIALTENRLTDAARSFAQAAEVQPTLVEAHYYLGVASDRLHQTDSARAAYTRALEQQPDNQKIIDALKKLGA
ncbi:MAG TPA: tetratricopeptide repeat protein [bacterium]|nr:tetratricopeptide repeat protein [bacterium]